MKAEPRPTRNREPRKRNCDDQWALVPATVRHQRSQNPNGCISSASPNQVPFSVLLQHYYRTLSVLLEEAENEVGDTKDWHESKQIFLPALLSLWIQAGRPEIKWPQLAGLPAADSGQCVLQSYYKRVEMMSNVES